MVIMILKMPETLSKKLDRDEKERLLLGKLTVLTAYKLE